MNPKEASDTSAKTFQKATTAGQLSSQKPAPRGQKPQVDSSFDGKLPIEWVHVPKAGGSFLNTLIHIPGACPGLPPDLYVSEKSMGGGPFDIHANFRDRYQPEQACNASVWDAAFGRYDHEGIESSPIG